MIPSLEQLPAEVGGWHAEDFAMDVGSARVLAADATLQRRYRRGDGTEAWLFVGYFAQQQVNSQIHSPRNCIPAGGWTVSSLENVHLTLNEAAHPATHMRITRNEYSDDVFYWFSTQGGRMGGEYALKWDLVRNSLARRPTNAAFVRYTAARADSAALHELMGLMQPSLDQVLGKAGLK